MKRFWEQIGRRRMTVPSWLFSLVFHLVLLLLLAMVIRAAPRGTSSERTADVGIVLKQQQGDEVTYQSGENDSSEAAQAESAVNDAAATSLQDIFRDEPPVDMREALPSSLAVIGPGALESGSAGSAQGTAADGSVGRAAGGLNRGAARAGFFGIEKEGFKFVYVIDRSGSMGGSGRNALDAAKSQVLASIADLGDLHQFQIIFYNEKPWVFNPSDLPGRLALATDPNKARAKRFIDSVTADGGTRHEDALLAAIRLQPDVIFFLTDADEPKLSPRQLDKIRQRSHGISISAVEFGFGPQKDRDNFLVRLARENNGEHVYVDVSKLFPVGR